MTKTPMIADVPLAAIQSGPTIRAEPHSEEYFGLLARVIDDFPPVVLQEGTYRVIDGAARIEATRRCGRSTIPARLVAVSDAELFVDRVRRNSQHGQPLTRADGQAIIKELLIQYPGWCNTMIAAVVGVHPTTVGRARSRSIPAVAGVERRLGLDGRTIRVSQEEPPEYDQVRALITGPEKVSLNEAARRTGVPLVSVKRINDMLHAEAPKRVAVEPDSVTVEREGVITRLLLAAVVRVLTALAGRVGALLQRIRLAGWWRVRQPEPQARSTRHDPTKETT